MNGKTPFGFALSEVEEVFGELESDTDLYISANVTDWYWVEEQMGWSSTRVIHDSVKLNVLGPTFRTFKPRVPFTVYVSTRNTILNL